MQQASAADRVVLSVGGSLIVPPDGISIDFLRHFRQFIQSQHRLHPQRQFLLVAGGGQVCRDYNAAAEKLVPRPRHQDLDVMGIQVSRVNAQLLRIVLGGLAYPEIITELPVGKPIAAPVVVAGGWRPGNSTDFVAVRLAEEFGARCIINLSNITQVYDADPAEHPNAKPLAHLSWADFQKLVGTRWRPGLNMPFDPIASKHAAGLGLEVAIMNGGHIANIEAYLAGKEFVGTLISNARLDSLPK